MRFLARCTAPSNSGFIYSPLELQLHFPLFFLFFSFLLPQARSVRKKPTHGSLNIFYDMPHLGNHESTAHPELVTDQLDGF